MELVQVINKILNMNEICISILTIVNKFTNFSIKKKKKEKRANYHKIIKTFKKLLKKYNLNDVSEDMILIILDATRMNIVDVSKCADAKSRDITDMLLKENYLYISNNGIYMWRKETELKVLRDYYYRLMYEVS